MMGKMEDGRRSGAAARAFAAMLPNDHLLRRIDRLLDMAELREALAPHYSARGRPSVDPELLLRMALIGRLYAIPSERRLCEELRYNLAYRWFCRLRPDSAVPHHSTLSKARHGRLRIAGVFRLLFERTVQRCQSAGLIGGKDFVIDASFVAADASWQRKARCGEVSASSIAPARAIREWLQDSAGMPEPDAQAKGATAILSRTDPAAAWSARTARGRFGYALNILMDAPSGVVVEVEATPARFSVEVDAGRIMLQRAAERFGVRAKRIVADTAYGSTGFLAFIQGFGGRPHIPVMERAELAGPVFHKHRFAYDRERDQYICPAGHPLRHRGLEHRVSAHRYSASPLHCGPCPMKSACAPGRARSLVRMFDEDARDLARAEMETTLFKRSMRLRQGIERLFADAKARRGLGRLRLRGLRGAQEEFLVGAAVLNLIRLARPDDAPHRRPRANAAPMKSMTAHVSRAVLRTHDLSRVAKLPSSATAV